MTYVDDEESYKQGLAQYLVRDIRAQVRVGRQWRKDTWHVVMGTLIELGAGMREAGPIASSYYASSLAVAIEYLEARPNRVRARELTVLLSIDVASYLRYCPSLREAQLSPTERKLLSDARIAFTTATLQMQMLCPDTT